MHPSRSPAPASPLLEQLHPPTALAAAAEALAGAVIAGADLLSPLPYVAALAAAATHGAAGLFSGYFDRAARTRAEGRRQGPAARSVEPATAWRTGWALLAVGLLLPAIAGKEAALAGLALALLAVLSTAVLREAWGTGFLAFGLARGATLALGLVMVSGGLARFGAALLPVLLYAVGWAVLRTARQRGAPPSTPFVALLHLAASVSTLLFLARNGFNHPVEAGILLAFLLAMTFPRFVRAGQQPTPAALSEALQYGFLGLTMLAAVLVAGYRGGAAGALIALVCIPLYQALRRWPVAPAA